MSPQKAIYGLKQLVCQWSKDLNKSIIKAGLKRIILDYAAFAKNLATSKVVILIDYVDNFLFFGPDFIEINIVKSFLANQYKIKDLRSCGQLTGIKLEQNLKARTISLSRRAYMKKVLEHNDMLGSKLVHFSIVSGINFCKNVNELLDEDFICLYQSHIGIHMWAYICTCPILALQFLPLANFHQIPLLNI